MPATDLPSPSLPAFGVWHDLAGKTGGRLVASAQAVGRRSGRLAPAGPLPSAYDRRRAGPTGLEKVEEAAQSAAATGSR